MSFIQICIHDKIYQQYDSNEISIAVVSATGSAVILQQYGTVEDFPNALPGSKKTPLILFTNQVEDFNRLNALAKERNRQKNTLILWDGVEDSRPKADKIPVLSTEKLGAQKNLLNWEALCALAQEDTPIVKKKPFWKRIFD